MFGAVLSGVDVLVDLTSRVRHNPPLQRLSSPRVWAVWVEGSYSSRIKLHTPSVPVVPILLSIRVRSYSDRELLYMLVQIA